MEKIAYSIFSDVHGESEDSHPDVLLQMLRQREHVPRWVIGGDLYNVERGIAAKSLELMNYLRSHKEKIRRVRGNHDPEDDGFGIPTIQEYRFEVNRIKFCVKHGDEFDYWLHFISHPFVDAAIDTFCAVVKKTPSLNGLLPFFQKHLAKSLKRRAKQFATQDKVGIDVIICGHVHIPECVPGYVNTGGKKNLAILDVYKSGHMAFHVLNPQIHN